jgi:hypothetical protein
LLDDGIYLSSIFCHVDPPADCPHLLVPYLLQRRHTPALGPLALDDEGTAPWELAKLVRVAPLTGDDELVARAAETDNGTN